MTGGSEQARAAGLVVRSVSGLVLVVETTYKAHWEVVGGMVESREGLRAAARRECHEELGVPLPIGDLLVLDACQATERRPELVCALFDGGVHDESVVDGFSFPDGEIRAAHWVDVDTARHRCGPRVGSRLAIAVDALRSGLLPGPPLLLRDGTPTPQIGRYLRSPGSG